MNLGAKILDVQVSIVSSANSGNANDAAKPKTLIKDGKVYVEPKKSTTPIGSDGSLNLVVIIIIVVLFMAILALLARFLFRKMKAKRMNELDPNSGVTSSEKKSGATK